MVTSERTGLYTMNMITINQHTGYKTISKLIKESDSIIWQHKGQY